MKDKEIFVIGFYFDCEHFLFVQKTKTKQKQTKKQGFDKKNFVESKIKSNFLYFYPPYISLGKQN